MRYTNKISVWPVGLVGYLRYERPLVKHNKVVGWFTAWKPERLFATDMAGFATNIQLFFENPDAEFSNYVKRGELESELIKKLHITLDDLEPKADQCTKVCYPVNGDCYYAIFSINEVNQIINMQTYLNYIM